MELDFTQLLDFCDEHNFICETFSTIDSTNEYLKNFVNGKQPMVCTADYQSAGKGRIGKSWYSPAGKNIYLSFLLPNYSADLSLPVSLVVATSLIEVLAQQLQAKADLDLLKIKWPNDIMFDEKKLAGILVELLPRKEGGYDLLVGFGLNVNMQADSESKVGQPWTSLLNISGNTFIRDELASRLLEKLYSDLLALRISGFASFVSTWNKYDLLKNRKFRLTSAAGNILVTGAGVDSKGHLLVIDALGKELVFNSGEVTLKIK